MSLLVLLVAGCNAILGIREPIDGEARGTGGTAGSGGGGGGESGDTSGGSGASSGSRATGGASPTGGSGGESGGGESGSGGDASGSGGTGTIVITTGALPGARLNIDFEVALEASGGDGSPYTWAFGDEALPTTLGLVLESDGRVHGAPTATGTFEFDATATDGESSDTMRLTLTVTRSRWLVYESDEEEYGKYYLYAVDVTKEPLYKVRLPGDVPPTVQIPKFMHFSFSPDGKYLAYLANFNVGNQNPTFPYLYVVDMTGEEPGDPIRVSGTLAGQGSAVEFEWSPDSLGLAFAVGYGSVPTPLRIFYAAVSNITTTCGAGCSREIGDVVGDDQWDSLGWVGPDLLAYSSWNALAYTRPFVNVQGQPFEQLFSGTIMQSWPELETALVMSLAENECLDGTWNLVDFRMGSLRPRELVRGYVTGSPGLEYIAYRDPDTKLYAVYRPWGTTPLTSFESGGMGNRSCSPGAWSRDGSVFAAGGDDIGGDREKLVVTTLDEGEGRSGTAPGDYGNVGQHQPPVFSRNDEWLGFSTNLGAFVAKRMQGGLAQGAIGEIMPVDPDALPAAPFSEPLIRFSPDSRSIVSAEPAQDGHVARVLVASLDTGQPEGSFIYFMSEGGGIQRIEWSPHSTEFAMIGRSAGGPSPTELYLARDLPTGFVVTKLNAPTSCSETDATCEQVRVFEFQP